MSDIQEQIKLAHKRAEENDIKLLKEEIKEILESLDKISKAEYYPEDLLTYKECKLLLDYITNLQEELEELREDNYAYHQLIKMENEREYRSKFLKEFQEEFGKNVFPDYDEIYKRYDKLKKENKKLKELCDKYEEEHNNVFKLWTMKMEEMPDYEERMNYKLRNEKVIEFCNYSLNNPWYSSEKELLGAILKKAQGVDKE